MINSFRNRNLPTSLWSLLPQFFMQASSTWGTEAGAQARTWHSARPHMLAALHKPLPKKGPNQKRRPWGASGQWDYTQKSSSRCKPLQGSSAETKVKNAEAQLTRQSDGQPWSRPACRSCPWASQVRRWRQRPHIPLIQGPGLFPQAEQHVGQAGEDVSILFSSS